MHRSHCLICNSQKLETVIDLGMHPFADTFIGEERISESEPVHPLVCNLCGECGHMQTRYITNPYDRYTKYQYSYTSSNSAFSKKHWINFCNEVSSNIELPADTLVVEVGSNDGFLGKQFLERGNRYIGLDASPFMAKLAEEQGIKTIVGLLNSENSKKITFEFGKANLVVANNVFNHADNPVEFVKSVSELLSTDGFFVFEVPYWFTDFKNHKFDKIYHEHINYFTVKSLGNVLGLAGMAISAAEVVEFHGGSLRIYAKKVAGSSSAFSNEILGMLKKEESYGVFEANSYHDYMKSISDKRNTFLKKLYSIKAEGIPIVAVGAAARGNTFLNYYNLDSTVIDYVTDVSEYKVGKRTPLTRIPIVEDSIFASYKDVYALVLTENISDNLKNILHGINSSIKFISS